MPTVTLEITVAWWLRLYLVAMRWFIETTGLEPDWPKLDAILDKGLSVREHRSHG